MTFWIYNLGMGIPVSNADLAKDLKLQPLQPLASSEAVKETPLSENLSNTRSRTTQNNARLPPREVPLDYFGKHEEHRPQRIFYAEQIMSNPIHSLSPETPFDQARMHFIRYRFRHFPVLNLDNNLIGIISDRDMLAQVAAHSSNELRAMTVMQIMQTRVLTASLKTTIRELCEVMLAHRISALPITDNAANLLGMVCRSDILKCLVQQGPLELWI